MNQVFKGNIEPFGAFLSGNLKIGGDLQYAVAFFDLVKLASEIITAFLGAKFSEEERHKRRLNKVIALEERESGMEEK